MSEAQEVEEAPEGIAIAHAHLLRDTGEMCEVLLRHLPYDMNKGVKVGRMAASMTFGVGFLLCLSQTLFGIKDDAVINITEMMLDAGKEAGRGMVGALALVLGEKCETHEHYLSLKYFVEFMEAAPDLVEVFRVFGVADYTTITSAKGLMNNYRYKNPDVEKELEEAQIEAAG